MNGFSSASFVKLTRSVVQTNRKLKDLSFYNLNHFIMTQSVTKFQVLKSLGCKYFY